MYNGLQYIRDNRTAVRIIKIQTVAAKSLTAPHLLFVKCLQLSQSNVASQIMCNYVWSQVYASQQGQLSFSLLLL